ncbi:MAG: CBS domain-containing protein [Planctomycetota bacterium]
MILRELMKERCPVFSLSKDSRISEAAEMMREQRIGSIVIIDANQQVIGMLTDRDIALTLALGAGTSNSFVSEAMSQDVVTVVESQALFDVVKVFRESRVKRLPVVDDSGQLVGVVSVDDVMGLLAREMFDTCVSLEPKLGHLI